MKSQRKTTIPNLAVSSPQHQEALNAGDNHHYSYLLNVEDRFKDKTQEQIQQALRDTAFPFAVCFEEWIGSFTISSGMRNANAFNAKEIFYLGVKNIDKRGMCGCYHYKPIQWLATMSDFIALKERYTIVGIDNVPGSAALATYEWQPNSLMVFGSEGVGLTPAMQALCDHLVYIPQFGSIRSLNAAVASGIVMVDYLTKYGAMNGTR